MTRLATIVLVSTVLAALVLTVRRGRPTRLHDGASASARLKHAIAAAERQRDAACARHDSDGILDAIAVGHRATALLKHTNPTGGSDANSPRPTHCHPPPPTRQRHTAKRRLGGGQAATTTAPPPTPPPTTSPQQLDPPPLRVLAATGRDTAPRSPVRKKAGKGK